ncbi:unnamed protein product [Larinioides sclopetarius]|uniref:Peptidoglycan-recognition protein n=1 Tax=Larinioides sclopetarius TaxID=280406 RepID=A0AAV2B024_9ARAC
MRFSEGSFHQKNMEFYSFLFLSLVLAGICDATCPEIVSRAHWGARTGRPLPALRIPVSHVFIHHTDGATCDSKDSCSRVVRQIQNYHIDVKGWRDIGYSFLVGGDGRIYEGRGWNKVGSHTAGYNSRSIGISFMGNYVAVEPNAAMIEAARNLIDCGVQQKYISASRQIHGHRNAKCTACPGNALYNIIERWPGFVGGRLPGYIC